jgi:Domain of unknown function (DUF4350)
MLNTRNVLAAVLIVMFLSLVGACVSLIQSPTGGGLGVDTYGTRGHGFRGLFEILEQLKIPVERTTVPPDRMLDRNMTLALIQPSPEIVSTEPAYLNAVGRWARAGGTVVVAPSLRGPESPSRGGLANDVLVELGLKGVGVHLEEPAAVRGSNRAKGDSDNLGADAKRSARQLEKLFLNQIDLPVSFVHATAEGTLSSRFPKGLDLVIPYRGCGVLDSDAELYGISTETPPKVSRSGGTPKSARGHASTAKFSAAQKKRSRSEAAGSLPAGRIRAVLETGGDPETLAAVYHVGDGSIAVLADARLAQNRLVGRGDNPVLVSYLLAGPQKPIVFDEFYHGLTIRSNPLWLVTRFPYNVLTITVLAMTLLAGWRGARFLGPPLAPRPASRRTLSEYLEAMARLLDRAHHPAPFLLSQIRQGLLWRIRHDLGLPPGQEDAEKVVRLLERRDPELAVKARDALRAIDDSLAKPALSSTQLETTLAKVSLCVPRRAL